MIYAMQISPEAQESPIFFPECFPENIAVYGNRSYNAHLPEVFKRVRDVLEDGYLADIIEDPDNFCYKNATVAISEHLWPEKRTRYSTRDISRLKKLVLDYSKARDAERVLLETLSIVTGTRWETRTIRGSCQGDWQTVAYPVGEWNGEDIRRFERLYFNEGSEWIIHEGDNAPQSADDVEGHSLYCVSWGRDAIKIEIAAEEDVKPEEVQLFVYAGERRIPIYEIA